MHVPTTSWHIHVWNGHTWFCSYSSDEWDGSAFSCRMGNLTHFPHHDLKSLKCQQTKDKMKKSNPFSVPTHLWREKLMKGTRWWETKFPSVFCDCHIVFVFVFGRAALTVETNQVLVEHLTLSLLRCWGGLPPSQVTFICYWTAPMMTIIKMKVLVKLTPIRQNIIISKYHLELKVLLDTIEINQFLW